MASKRRSEIRFLFGDEERVVTDVDPTFTVLDWLRTVEGKMGTKEGCAEGDCGACTVLVGRRYNDRMRYESVNACIRFLATLDGCHLVTVEHLKRADGSLHPVQQALVECHGSQCGFCTPGFVMSLYTLWLNEESADDDRLNIALQGNLCRCTGYEPILKAGRRMYELSGRDEDPRIANQNALCRRLADMTDDARIEIAGKGRRYLAPATADDLAEVLSQEPQATMVAGATDVGLWVTKDLRRLDPVVYIGRLDELRRLEDGGDHLWIGGLASYSDAWPFLAKSFPALDEFIGRIGGEQIRNMGTVGGNIANGSPIGDMPPPLIALGAEVVLRSRAGRRRLPLEDFFIDYGKQDRKPEEFVEAVVVPKLKPDATFETYKVTKRLDEDITAVCAAICLTRSAQGTVADIRIAYGGMAATPKRAAVAEATLMGKAWDQAAIESAIQALAKDFQPISDWRASADYRAKIAGNLLQRFYLETTRSDVATRVASRRRFAHA